jgi:hypothetical protein
MQPHDDTRMKKANEPMAFLLAAPGAGEVGPLHLGGDGVAALRSCAPYRLLRTVEYDLPANRVRLSCLITEKRWSSSD